MTESNKTAPLEEALDELEREARTEEIEGGDPYIDRVAAARAEVLRIAGDVRTALEPLAGLARYLDRHEDDEPIYWGGFSDPKAKHLTWGDVRRASRALALLPREGE